MHAALWAAVRAGAGRAAGGRLQLPARPGSGGRLFADPGSDRAPRSISRIGRLLAAQTPPKQREESDLRDRQPAQPRRGADHVARGARAARRAQPGCGQARQGSTAYASALTYLVAGAALLAERRLGAPARADLRAGAATGRMRVPDRRSGGGGGSAWRRLARARDDLDQAVVTCLRMDLFTSSVGATGRSRSVSTTCAVSASTGRRIRPRRRCGANTSGSGRSSGAARSRR